MKKMLFMLGALIISGAAFSQPNNPNNKRGTDFVTSVSIIQNDYYAGKIKEFNDETLARYKKIIPLQVQADMKLVNSVIEVIRNPKFNYQQFVNNSRLSVLGKEILTLLPNPKGLDERSFNALLINKVDEVKRAKLDVNEKDFLFDVIAMRVSSVPFFTDVQTECSLVGTEGNPKVPCWMSGMIIGATTGMQLCGPWCALGGAIIGAVAGAFSS